MEILRILFALGCLAPGYYAMEIQPSVLPRNLDVYCKFCDGLSAVFDNVSYEDYDFWRTIDIQEKVRFFCSFCKKTTESTNTPTMTSETTTTSPQPETQSASTTTTTSVPGTQSDPATTPEPQTQSVPATTTPEPETPSSSTENSSPTPESS